MISRNSGRLRYPYSPRVQTSGEKRAGRSPRNERYERGPGALTPKAISASLASAMIKAREDRLLLISANFVSSDFMKEPERRRLPSHQELRLEGRSACDRLFSYSTFLPWPKSP